ncbi:MAG: protein-tyrosine phosphatase family protein [Anaerolineales bacterium]
MTELPFGFPGRVLRSVMPFSDFDSSGEAWKAYQEFKVNTVFVLAGAEECLNHTGIDLLGFYREQGMKVVHVPVTDHATPADREALDLAVDQAWERARAGSAVAVHCYAGIGRTGTFAALLARRALGMAGDEAITWLRKWVPGALETVAQQEYVLNWRPRGGTGPAVNS